MTHYLATELNNRFHAGTAEEVVSASITEIFPARNACVSSFGTESAVLLHMISGIDPAAPILFLDSSSILKKR